MHTFSKIDVLKNVTNLTGKYRWKERLQACNFIKKRLQHRCFSVKCVKFLRTPFFTEHLRWLLPNFGVLGCSEQWLFVRFETFWEKHPCLSLFSVNFPSNYSCSYLKNPSGVNGAKVFRCVLIFIILTNLCCFLSVIFLCAFGS